MHENLICDACCYSEYDTTTRVCGYWCYFILSTVCEGTNQDSYILSHFSTMFARK